MADSTTPSTLPNQAVGAMQATPSTDPWAAVWRGLSQPLLVQICGLLTLVLLLAAMALPQLPGHLADDPAAAARWLAGQRASMGGLGDLFSTLGLYDLLHSPLLGILLAVTALLLLVHLANWVNVALAYWRLPDRLKTPSGAAGEPLALPSSQRIYRLRCFTPLDGDIADWQQTLEPRFDHRWDVDAPFGQMEDDGDETRILATRHRWAAYLRPVHIVGLLLALLSVWIAALFGWQIDTPLLAPAEHFRYAGQDIDVTYETQTQGEGVEAVIRTQIGSQIELRAVEGDATWQVGAHDVMATLGPPSLLVSSTDNTARLTRPGSDVAEASLGLLFPTPGSEQSFLLPDAGLGLRIVRASKPATEFAVELFASDEILPIQRFTVVDAMEATIGADPDELLTLRFVPLPALALTIRYAPGAWLLWPALLLTLVGLVAVLM
ncbi:MAG: hypothetical protein HC802_16605, partial [Caldilineaceae bacterium]|nr:hypothetical protein [Caldilineaceae bacterium]